MKRFLWIPVSVLLMAGPATGQADLLTEREAASSLSSQDVTPDRAILSSDIKAENEAADPSRLPPMTVKEKLHYYIKSTYEPKSIAFSLAGAGIKQARDSVPEWGQGMEGYGRRFASSFGHKIVKRNLQFGMGALLHEDPRYFFSERQGIMPRALFAASRAFVSNKDGGGTRPGYSKLIATFGGAYISRQWYPERKQTAGEYLTSTAISFGVDTAKNVFNEFWPDIKKLLKR